MQSTGRHAEGTAVGFNKKKKGARSYYPLLCTIAQTDQVPDVHHQPGNVHDSNGAKPFIHRCFSDLRTALPTVRAERRMDSAFFNEAIVDGLHMEGIEFTISVPFERFTDLKGIIEGRRRRHRLNAELDFLAAILAHNLTRELHMQVDPQARATTEKRAPLWCFRELDTLRRTLIQRAGRIIKARREAHVVEDYPEDSRGHSCLMLGEEQDGRPIHVVCSPKEEYLAIITAYVPSEEEWESDFRLRKSR